jgi:hypothetical protein
MSPPFDHLPSSSGKSGGLGLLDAAWRAAVAALKANLLPGLILQAIMAGMALAYLFHPSSRSAFEELAILRSAWGLIFSFIGTSFASSIFPEVLRLLLPKTDQLNAPDLRARLLFGIPFWGLIGMQVDLFYRLQYFLFGPSDTIPIIAQKVFVDAFVYCPLLAMPQAVCAFIWRDHGFSFHGFHGHRPLPFYALRVFPVLMANWMVWIPLVCIIYSLPPALGIPFFIVAQSFWVMVFTTLAMKKQLPRTTD